MAISKSFFLLTLGLSLFQSALADVTWKFSVADLVASNETNSNTTISMLLYDPNTPNSTISCTQTFPSGTSPPAEIPSIEACEDKDMRVTWPTYNGPNDFTMLLVHDFEDEDMGPPPYNYITLLANFTIAEGQNYTCNEGKNYCEMPSGVNMTAYVWGTYA